METSSVSQRGCEIFLKGAEERTFAESMSNAIRIGYYANNYRNRSTHTVVIFRGDRILARAERATFKEALAAARAAL